MSDSFTKKRLDLTIALSGQTFEGTNSDTATLSGHRMMADLVHRGGDSMGEVQLRVFGLTQSMMNQLTLIGNTASRINPLNKMLLAAGDDESGMKMVFKGTIFNAWADYNSAPDVAFIIQGLSGLGALVVPVGASSYRGATDAALIMKDLANTMGFSFENNGVSVILSNPYFDGTALSQVRKCAQAANIWYSIDRDILAIWPKGGARVSGIPKISKASGMIGYPALNSAGMSVQTMFNWDILPGGKVEVESTIPMATGLFNVGPFVHNLSSEVPGGPWSTTLECYRVIE